MGNVSIETRCLCCISESNLNEEDEEIATPRTKLEEPFKVDKIESLKTLPDLH